MKFFKKQTILFGLVTSVTLGILTIAAPTVFAAPQCFDLNGKSVTCQSGASSDTGPLADGKCYREQRGGPNGDLQGYFTVDCSNPNGPATASGGGTGQSPTSTSSSFPQAAKCVSLDPSFKAAPTADNPCAGTSCTDDLCNFVANWVQPIVTFLAIGFGIIVTITIVVSGIQYSASKGDPQQVAAAKKRIVNAVIALIAFAFMYALLQFLVPGGLFK